jgi:hypothetical protein
MMRHACRAEERSAGHNEIEIEKERERSVRDFLCAAPPAWFLKKLGFLYFFLVVGHFSARKSWETNDWVE